MTSHTQQRVPIPEASETAEMARVELPIDIWPEGSRVTLSGNTYAYRNTIKSLPGAKWNNENKTWSVLASSELEDWIDVLVCMAVEAEKRDIEYAAWKQKIRTLLHSCCEKADYVPIEGPNSPYVYKCPEHGIRHSPRGLFRGD